MRHTKEDAVLGGETRHLSLDAETRPFMVSQKQANKRVVVINKDPRKTRKEDAAHPKKPTTLLACAFNEDVCGSTGTQVILLLVLDKRRNDSQLYETVKDWSFAGMCILHAVDCLFLNHHG